jgi:hypothetical protein
MPGAGSSTPVILATQEARDLEELSSKLAQANSLPISKNPSQKRADRVAQGVDPEFKPQYQKKKKKLHIYIYSEAEDRITEITPFERQRN